MKRVLLVVACFATLTLSGCTRPKNELVEIGPLDTAILVPLEGDNFKNQDATKTIQFLESKKVSAKRIEIPHKYIDTCPGSGMPCNQDVATVKLFTVSHKPVHREWTSLATTGTSPKNQAFVSESSESIDFHIGATILAHVEESDAAVYLYRYAGVPLEEVIDNQVRAYVSSALSQQFGVMTYDQIRNGKVEIFHKALAQSQDFFKPQGITIDALGFSDGLTPTDQSIQKAINDKFAADMKVEVAKKTLDAANMFAQSKEAVKAQQELENRKRELDIQAAAVAKWNGVLPTNTGGVIPFINLSGTNTTK